MQHALPILALLAAHLVVPRVGYGQETDSTDFGMIRASESFLNTHHAELFDERDPEVRAEFEAMQWEFIRRPRHDKPEHLSSAYRNLYDLARTDSTYDPAKLADIVDGLAMHASSSPTLAYGRAPVLLAERSRRFDEAEALVRRGLDSILVQMERDREWFADEEEYASVRDEQLSMLTDALGRIHALAGRPDSAEAALLRANALWRTNVDNLHHLGRHYEERGNDEQAEHFYRLGAVAPSPEENPNRPALKALYRRTRGSLEGWDAYQAAFEEADRELRRSTVLAAREAHPEKLPPFRLENPEGIHLASDDLRGRVLVVNFWGVWCSWCVKEMPEFQLLHERYRDDPDVAILTINNDDDWDMARRWVEEHEYEFTVLRDDGYVVRDAGITGFPTTWFVDRDGHIAFQQRGWTEKLLEEFSWRIEALRE